MSTERPEIPRDDYRVAPKVKKAPKRGLRKVVDKDLQFAFIKANLAMHGVLNPDGSWKKW